MTLIRYNITARSTGTPTPGLSPVWNILVQSNGGTSVSNPNTVAPITALSGGGYQIAYDPAGTLGELYGIIDFGSSMTDPNERYTDITLVADPSFVYNASSVAQKFTFTGSNVNSSPQTNVNLNMAQTVPTSNTVQTVGDSFNASRANGFGRWVLSGTTLTLYAGDSSTVVRTFTLDSATNPMQRT